MKKLYLIPLFIFVPISIIAANAICKDNCTISGVSINVERGKIYVRASESTWLRLGACGGTSTNKMLTLDVENSSKYNSVLSISLMAFATQEKATLVGDNTCDEYGYEAIKDISIQKH